MNHIGRSFAIAFALIVGVILLAKTPVGQVVQASLVHIAASVLNGGR